MLSSEANLVTIISGLSTVKYKDIEDTDMACYDSIVLYTYCTVCVGKARERISLFLTFYDKILNDVIS